MLYYTLMYTTRLPGIVLRSIVLHFIITKYYVSSIANIAEYNYIVLFTLSHNLTIHTRCTILPRYNSTQYIVLDIDTIQNLSMVSRLSVLRKGQTGLAHANGHVKR